MLGMSHLRWPEGIEFKQVALEPEERGCAHCGRFTYICDHKHRDLYSLGRPLHVKIGRAHV